MNTLKKIIAANDSVVMVDTSDEACKKFGFRSGDIIICKRFRIWDEKGVVVGVSRNNLLKEEVLWLIFDNNYDNGKARFDTKENIKSSYRFCMGLQKGKKKHQKHTFTKPSMGLVRL